MAEAYSIALEDIPTERLRACFVRAIRGRRDGFPPASGDVLTEWEGLREELRVQGQQHAENELLRLKAGHGSLGLMTLGEFKERHNLPATWKLGQPYPPESDLYEKPLPPRDVPWGGCDRCADAGWLVNRDTPKHPVLTKCPDCNGTGKAGYAAPY